MELAERLGMTAGELMRRMPSTEFTEWVALYNLRAREAKQAQQKQRLKGM